MRTTDGFMVSIGDTVYDQHGCEWDVRGDGVYRKEPVYSGMTSNRYGWGDIQHADHRFYSSAAAAVRSQIMELTQQQREIADDIDALTGRLAALAAQE